MAAVEQISEEDRQQIDIHNSDRKGLLQDVIKIVEGKRDLCVEKQWKFRTGSVSTPLRDPFARIAAWINKFRDVGTIMMQYDPTHAAIPWAAIRFVLEVSAQNSGVCIANFVSNELIGGYERFSNL